MSYVRRIDGIEADFLEFTWSRALSEAGKRVTTHVWVFTDGLVVTPTTALSEPWFPNRVEALQRLDLEALEPDISGVVPKVVRLDQERVCRIEYGGPNGFGFFKRFGGFDAYFFFADESWFRLIVPRSEGRAVLALLRDLYPGKVEDHRDDYR